MAGFIFRPFTFAVLVCAALPVAGQLTWEDLLAALPFRGIGPASMSGRIADLDVDPKNNAVIYVATASGGVWKSTSGGIEWTPIFDTQGSGSIGDVEVSDADSNVVWVGTGEHSNRNSVGWGDGMYKSTDGGKTWLHVGLKDSQQIARIITHPTNVNKVWVAVIGPLWNSGGERGVYMTTDGGATWTRTLYTDEETGACDLVIDPTNPDILYAGMWERRRYPYTFRSGGPNGGVFKSTDGGKTWKKLKGGLPEGLTGKIGLTIFPKNPNILYAIIEAERGSKPEDDKNGIYRTEDAGKTWTRMGNHATRPFYYHEILVDPEDDARVYSLSTNMMLSTDKGKTWRAMRNRLHVDYHAIWIDPKNPNYIWVGNDGGAAFSYDKGNTWKHASQIAVPQFYAICYDMAVPYHVYGGLQDNGSWGGPSISRNRSGIGNYEWYRLSGGDGFHVQVDWADNETIYSESQGGAIQRLNKRTRESRSIRPRPPQGERYRFNWSSPIVMSPHNPRIIWFGGNKLFKSVDRGDNWEVVSPDLTTNDPAKQGPMPGLTQENTGAETHCTIVTISESPVKPDVVWVGTDDGLVQLTQNGGVEWTNVTDNIHGVPKNTWVSRVVASKYKLERCYATFDGHRTGDMNAYVFVTEDFGKTWTNITANLPSGSVYVIREDPVRESVLYIGTEFGLFVSFDRGINWLRWKNNLPTVAVHDLLIHPRDKEIIVGTHGRGIWIAPVEAIQYVGPKTLEEDFALVDPVTARGWIADAGAGYGDGQGHFFGENPPFGARIKYALNNDAENVKVEIIGPDAQVLASIPNPPKTKGLHVVYWNLRPTSQAGPGGGPAAGGRQGQAASGQFLTGSFVVRLTVNDRSVTKPLVIEPDPLLAR